jgi:two-component system LytT family response regulator
MMIHAVLADNEVLARQKLHRLLRDELEIEIVGESSQFSSAPIHRVSETGRNTIPPR